ncbi:hypothetical protein IWX90DRAFT_34367 [Phyllosticta citrichinensis]|uniref:Secreted protein n=1 Tax=Phyllosticta citrichinensis TaxID=1130410 RepID=A0ABR1Y7U1_9PEZI
MEMRKANRAMFIHQPHTRPPSVLSHGWPLLLPAHLFRTLLLVVLVPSSVRASVASVLGLPVWRARSVPVSFCRCLCTFRHPPNHFLAGNDVRLEASQTTVVQTTQETLKGPPRVPTFWRWQGSAVQRSAAQRDARPGAYPDQRSYLRTGIWRSDSRDARLRVYAPYHSRQHSPAVHHSTAAPFGCKM